MAEIIKMPKKCFVKIEGQEDGTGPFHWSYRGVSPQLLLVLEELLPILKGELFEIIQGEAVEEYYDEES